MALEILLSSTVATAAVIEGPSLSWRGGPRTTSVTALASSQHESQSCAHALSVQEKLIGENNLRPIAFLEQALRIARAVTLVQVTGKGSATGFLVGYDLLMTNNHVLRNAEEAGRARTRFNYQTEITGGITQSEYFACRPDLFFHTNPRLDYSLVAVEGSPGARYGVVPIVPNSEVNVGDRVAIVQHPLGQPKQIALVDNEVAFLDGTIAQYLTDTLPGSSGSPVFNESWELVALHHSGGWIPEPGSNSTHFRNEGIRIRAIVDDLVNAGLAA